MFRFLIKKFFYLYIDHFYQFLLLNFFYLFTLLCGSGLAYLLFHFHQDPPPALIFLGVGIVLLPLNLYTGAAGNILNTMVDYKEVHLKQFWSGLHSTALNSLLFTILNLGLLFLTANALLFYLNSKLVFAPMVLAFIAWLVLLWVMASQFFFAVHYRLEKNFLKLLKKMVLIFLDNLLFSCFCSLLLFILTILSVPTLLMLPGMISLQFFCLVAIRTRLYKYTYLEQQRHKADDETVPSPGGNIPWETLLMEDAKQLGKRSLKSTFFPSGKS